MSRAVSCPVCLTKGKYEDKVCHGCNGKGWVEVRDEPVIFPEPYKPRRNPDLYPLVPPKPWRIYTNLKWQ